MTKYFRIFNFKSIFFVAGLLFNAQIKEVSAQEFYCAAVMPDCDNDANPLPPFDDISSPCYPVYANICLKNLLVKLQQKEKIACPKKSHTKRKKKQA